MTEYDDEMEEEFGDEVREDAIEADMEAQKDAEDYDLEPGAIQVPEPRHDILKFLQDVLEAPNRYKTAYLTWEELGKPTFSTRFWLNLANTCDKLFDMELVSLYCRMKAGVTTDTSLSRDGFMVTTSVTQKRIKEKKSSSDLARFLASRGKHGQS